jgi:hypothetical protein
MNLLIIAGLLGLALVAILVAVLLGMSEQQAEKARANNATALPESAPATASPVETGKVVTGNAPSLPALSATTQKNALVNTDEQMLPALNGQFREFASELRSLHQQAWELEQHLRGMTEMVDRIENTPANHISIEEETRTRSQADNL